MNLKKLLRLALGAGFAGLFIWMILRHVDAARMAEVLRGARPALVLGGVLALCLGYACRVARWRVMLNRGNPTLRFTDCAGPLLASFAANNVLPFRAGDILRAFAFNERLGTTSGTVLATLLVERLLDLLMVVWLLGLAVWVFHFDVGGLLGVGAPLLLLAGLAILAVLLFPRMLQPLLRWLGVVAARMPAAAKVQAELGKITQTLGDLARGSTMPRLIGWSAAAWLMEGGAYALLAKSLASIAVPMASWLALPVGTLATLIPSTPGYVGTFDYFAAQAMVLAGNELTAAAAFAFLVHMVLWLPPTLAGGFYMALWPAKATQMPKEQTS